MAFTGIAVDTIIGDANSGVQAMFPRFTFDASSRPSLGQVQEYAKTAIANVSRLIKFKGYDPAAITDDEDLVFVANWIKLTVAAEIHTVLDQFKDNSTANSRLAQLRDINSQFKTCENPFPGLERVNLSEAEASYPTSVVRDGLNDHATLLNRMIRN